VVYRFILEVNEQNILFLILQNCKILYTSGRGFVKKVL